MTLSATHTFISWSGVTATPPTGSVVAIDRVTNVKPDNTGEAKKFKGDANRYWAVVAVPTQERMLDIETGDIAAAMSLVIGVVYAIAATLGDAINGTAAGGGGISIAQVNAVLTKRTIEGEHAEYAKATLTFESFANTGDTDPLTVTSL